jgi:hypothetical protein
MARPGKVSVRRVPATDERPLRSRRYKHLVLIVCEDQTTEPLYFETVFANVPVDTLYIRSVGTGRDPLGVAQQALVEREKLAVEARLGMEPRREVDDVWLVFDKDDADREAGKIIRFEQALALANAEKMKLAFSNEVFELWLLLHLTEVAATQSLPRAEVYARLGSALRQHPKLANFEYQHGVTKAADVVPAVLSVGDEASAHRRAAALLAAHGAKPLLETNPSTRVHHLMSSLRGWMYYYSG